MNYPKISIITPNYNQAAFLERTILSVLQQGYPNLEYIIMDGGSTDGSVEIIKKYEDRLAYWVSEPDKGMYHAIQKGMDKSSGEIMAWINSDDVYFKNSLFTVAEIFSRFPHISWFTCNPAIIDEDDRMVESWTAPRWSRYRFLRGKYQWIQQESTFWRRPLWEAAGSVLDPKFKLAGDLELWTRFFQHAQLYSVKTCLAGFRIRKKDQKSLEGLQEYLEEAAAIFEQLVLPEKISNHLKYIQSVERLGNRIPVLRRLSRYNALLHKLYEVPALIEYKRASHSFEFSA